MPLVRMLPCLSMRQRLSSIFSRAKCRSAKTAPPYIQNGRIVFFSCP
jgi:hypothetical protein